MPLVTLQRETAVHLLFLDRHLDGEIVDLAHEVRGVPGEGHVGIVVGVRTRGIRRHC